MPVVAAPMVLKQLVAVIDGNTTAICLSASGQIRPIDVPYDTLAGSFDEPPFHVHCRSISAPYMSGMVNQLRELANLELRRRTAKQRALADPRSVNKVPGPDVPAPASVTPVVRPEFAQWGDRAAEIQKLADDPSMVVMRAAVEHQGSSRGAEAQALRDAFERAVRSAGVGNLEVRDVTVRESTRGYEVGCKFYDVENREIAGALERVIEVKPDGELSVEHALFSMRSKWQGHGFASRVNRALEDWYIANGVSEITLHANLDVGGYAWARAGFDWDPVLTSAGDVGRLVRSVAVEAKMTEEQQRAWMIPMLERLQGSRENWPTPYELAMFGYRDGAQTWPGKKAMLLASWRGVKRLVTP